MAVAPQNIMAQLRGMPDVELAKFAATHKNDPFIFPLAFQESQSRKQLRASQQAKMAGQEKPKVVDQAMSQMAAVDPMGNVTGYLPEDIGIGRLPAKNLTRMADGGIVAFDEGGEVEVPKFADEGLVRNPLAYLNPSDRWADIQDYFKRQQIAAAQRGTGNLTGVQQDFEIPESTLKGTGDTSAIDQMAVDMAKNQKKKGAPNTNPDLTMADKGKKDTGAGKKNPGGISALAPAQADANAAPSGLSGLAAYAKEGADYTGPSPLEGQQARLDKQEAKDVTDRKDALNMALLKAGLGMMGGKSQYALQNIAEGAKGGLEDYNASMKDLKLAAKERDKMRNELENAAYAYKRDDVKGYQSHMEKADDRATEMKKAQLSADTNLQVANIHKSATLGAAGMPSAQERLVNRIGTDPKFAESYKNYVAMQPEARAGLVTRDSALKSWSGNIMLQSQYPNFEDYYKMATSGTPTASAGANTSGWGNMTVR